MTILSRRFTTALITAWASAIAVLAAPAVASAADGQIIVRYEPGADARERSTARAAADVVRDESLGLARTELVTPERGTSVSEAVADLERSPDVAYAEPDQPRRAFATPDDNRFAEQWALDNTGQPIWYRGSNLGPGTFGADINVAAAWDIVTATSAKVAVVDSGVALAHPDLVANIAPGGKDFVDGGLPADENGHGTHITGTIGASGDNTAGVTGVAWQAQLLPIRVLDAHGGGSLSDVIAGYAYADAQGARVANVSLGGDSPSQAEYDAIRSASEVLFVAAAGNDGEDVDAVDSYPCAYDLPNLVCVAATDGDDDLAGFSNYGDQSVDLAAPGLDILSTYPHASNPAAERYEWLSGTSMATPHVAGAAALMLGQDPALTPWQAREMLLSSVDEVGDLTGKVSSGGRLDVAAALAAPVPDAAGTPVASALAPAPRVTVTPAPTSPTPAQPQPVVSAPTGAPRVSAPVTAVDRTAPALTLAVPARAALRSVLARGLRVPATCSERCSLRVALTLDRRTAARLRLARGSATVRVASGSAALSGAGSRAVTLRFTSSAKRALSRVRRITVTVRVTATDAAGNRRVRSRSVTLAR
jgi:subtilisin family serine protease